MRTKTWGIITKWVIIKNYLIIFKKLNKLVSFIFFNVSFLLIQIRKNEIISKKKKLKGDD